MLRLPCLLLLLIPALVFGEEVKYPENVHQKGKLKYVSGVPVLTLEGTSKEIGRQFGELALKPAKDRLLNRVDSYFEKVGWRDAKPMMSKAAAFIYTAWPKSNREELEAACKVADVDLKLMTILNVIPDLQAFGCSTLVVEPQRSETGKLLFGRNLDWPPHENLPENTMLIAIKSAGKRPVVMVSLPILLGSLTGINDAGLCLAINAIDRSKDNSPKRNLAGTPMLLLFRKILEECKTVDEAEAMLKAANRTTYFCLTVCDPLGGCVLEATPKSVVRRAPNEGCCCCTNHFRSEGLSVTTKCTRYSKLEEIQSSGKKLGVTEVWAGLHKVNQGPATMQSMVFEPKSRTLHLAYGGGASASAKKPTMIDLREYLEQK